MPSQSELQKKKVERLAAKQGITPAEYKRRCEINTARNQGLTTGEYRKKKLNNAAAKKNMTPAAYRRMSVEKSAANKGFRNFKDYDKAWHRAKVLNMSTEQYCNTLKKDEEGFYILPTIKQGRPKDR